MWQSRSLAVCFMPDESTVGLVIACPEVLSSPRDPARSRELRRHPAAAVSGAGRDLLNGPAVAVRVGEEDERAPRELLDLAHLDTTPDQIVAGGFDVGDDQLQARARDPVGVHQ